MSYLNECYSSKLGHWVIRRYKASITSFTRPPTYTKRTCWKVLMRWQKWPLLLLKRLQLEKKSLRIFCEKLGIIKVVDSPPVVRHPEKNQKEPHSVWKPLKVVSLYIWNRLWIFAPKIELRPPLSTILSWKFKWDIFGDFHPLCVSRNPSVLT